MAVKLESAFRRYTGLSSDTKPTNAQSNDGPDSTTPIPVGSSFLELDTGDIYRWSGTSWYQVGGDGMMADLLQKVLDSMDRMMERFDMVLEKL